MSLLTKWGADLGERLTESAVDRLGGAKIVESYGKGGIVGSDGELEHVAAMLHPELGAPLREVVGGGDAIIPSAKKRGGPGAVLDVPTHYKDEAYVRTHYDAMPVRIEDAPAADELVLIIVVTDGGRPHPRIGGLQKNGLED
ncbi:amino acid synthesis family protein [Natronomonas salina]|uniref:amino acid synthesis family protein n=1 Tax=Natronomonas salina TaxID=1710540 RepID=UPI001BA8DE48|nr:amino acid synthesis family protein [Natronomonas salina]